jgi:hypothetical protein
VGRKEPTVEGENKGNVRAEGSAREPFGEVSPAPKWTGYAHSALADCEEEDCVLKRKRSAGGK